MSCLSDAAAMIPALTGFCYPGLQAMTGPDRTHVSPSLMVTHSIALDEALRSAQPAASRWDYGVGRRRNSDPEELVWIEVHPASGGSGIHDVENKARWLFAWLAGVGRPLAYKPRRFVWVASGRSSFGRNDPKLRALQAIGIQFVGGHLPL